MTLTETGILAATSGIGEGGSVHVVANNQVILSNSYIEMQTSGKETGAGQGGNLTVQAADIHLRQSNITTETAGIAQGGSIQLAADNQTTFNDSQINLKVSDQSMLDGDGGKGNGGDLVIQAADVTFTNGSLVNATTLGAGQGGSVNLQATHQIQLDGSTTSISSSSHGPGKAGFITLQGANLLLSLIHI